MSFDLDVVRKSLVPSKVSKTLYNHFQDPEIHIEMKYNDMIERLDKYYCIDSEIQVGARLITIGTVEIANGYFILLLGHSHVLGDAQSLYRLAKMLSLEESPAEFVIDRVPGFKEKTEQVFKYFPSFFDLPMYKNWEQDLVDSTGIFQRSDVIVSKVKAYTLNLEYIKKLKFDEALKDGEEYITTNDIILWWFRKAANTESAWMVVSNRKRFGISSEYYGNYFSNCYLTENDFKTPGSIHRAVRTLKASIQIPLKQPKSISGVTNWTGNLHKIKFPNAEFLIHYPHQIPFPVHFHSRLFDKGNGDIGFLIMSDRDIDIDPQLLIQE